MLTFLTAILMLLTNDLKGVFIKLNSKMGFWFGIISKNCCFPATFDQNILKQTVFSVTLSVFLQ